MQDNSYCIIQKGCRGLGLLVCRKTGWFELLRMRCSFAEPTVCPLWIWGKRTEEWNFTGICTVSELWIKIQYSMTQTAAVHIFLASVNNKLNFSHVSSDLFRECLSTAYAHETLCYWKRKIAKGMDNEWRLLEDKSDRMWLNTSHMAEYGKPSGTFPLCWYPQWKLGQNSRAESVISEYQRAQCETLPLRANLYVSPVLRMSMKCAWTLGGLRVKGIRSENYDVAPPFFRPL